MTCLSVLTIIALLQSLTDARDQRPRASDGHSLLTVSKPRRPVALVQSDDNERLFVANRRTGTITIVDLRRLQPIAEFPIARQLADLVPGPRPHLLLAVDRRANELLSVEERGSTLRVVERLSVPKDPVTVACAADRRYAAVASLWSRQLTIVAFGSDGRAKTSGMVYLPFEPRSQLIVNHIAIVGDAFGGQLGIVDLEAANLKCVHSVPGHNVGGLALSHDRQKLWLAHQKLDPHAQTTVDDIHWGNLISNNLRRLSLRDVLSDKPDILASAHLYELGSIGRGAADPNGIAVAGNGTMVVALSGSGEVALGSPDEGDWARLSTGHQPTALCLSHNGLQAFVVNTLSDSVSIVDVRRRALVANIPLGPPAKLGPADHGEVLFHDARLSHEGWFSCHSCHADGHSNGGLNDNLTDGSYGTPKRVLSLLGVRDTAPYAWSGSVPSLSAQIRKSIHTTMRGRELSTEQVQDLEAYLRSLDPPPPLAPRNAATGRGKMVFETQRCARCHEPPTYTSAHAYDVGLRDEAGTSMFNPPSLRGVSHGKAFFHDGRAHNLEAVFKTHHHGLHDALSSNDVADLIEFLRTL